MPDSANPRNISDRFILDYLRREGNCTIQDLVDHAGVTATAIRQRLTRLMEQGLIERVSEAAGRGRPTHRYSLSELGNAIKRETNFERSGDRTLERKSGRSRTVISEVRRGLQEAVGKDFGHDVRGIEVDG